jgi:predicted dehydrogenase
MTIGFAAIGFAHYHLFNQVNALLGAGAELISFYDADPEKIAEFHDHYPQAAIAPSIESILEDKRVAVIVSAAIPNERAALGIQAMQAGKDYCCAKPAFTTMEEFQEAKAVQAQTDRIFYVYYGERFNNPATVKAGELVHAGAIGQVVQTVGFGPHRLLGHVQRPDWTFDRHYFGGVINDLASHQVDQFLYFTGSTSAEVLAANVGNFKHSQFPKIHDFGDITLRSPSATGYIRVDWLTPEGLNTWGDVRLFILGTEGYIELRKNTDIAGRAGDNHLFLVDKQGMNYMDCHEIPLPFGAQFVADVLNRSETAMTQAHCFLASELALKAELMAVELG